MSLRSRLTRGALLGAGVLTGLSLGAATLAGPAGAATDPASGMHIVGGTSQYTDPYGNVHLLGLVGNSAAATVEQPEVYLDLLGASGTQTVSSTNGFLPCGWLQQGEECPFDVVIPAAGFSGRWRVDHFVGQPDQVEPSHNFQLSGVTGPTNSADTAILHGKATNNNPYPVNLIKVIASFYDANGTIVYVEPTDVNSNDQLIPPGGEYPFQLPRDSGVPNFDPLNNKIFVEANEPGVAKSVTGSGTVGPFVKSSSFPKLPTFSTNANEHNPVANTSLNGVPNPSASDVAAAAAPSTVKRQHDSAPAAAGSDGPEKLLDASSNRPAARTTAAYLPIILIALVGGYGLLSALGAARAGVAGLAERRRLKRERLAALAPGSVGGYGAMPGADR